MRAYLIRRLLLVIPTLFLVTIFVFLLVRFIPGNVIDLMLADNPTGSELTREELLHSLGLDLPIHIQYAKWITNVVRGDLGESLWTNRSITADIISRLPISMELGAFAILTALLIAIPIGVYSAMRQDTWGDYAGRTVAILCISLPAFWVGTMVIVYASVWLNWSPAVGYIPITKDVLGNLLQFVIPGFIMGMVMSGSTMRMTRTMMLEVLKQDYIRTAWSKGLGERTVIIRHAMKNALMPVVTIVGMMLPVLIGGSVILEQIFALPGIGRFLIDALNRRDYPVISGINLVMATFVLAMNIIVDVSYGYLDPRVKLS